MKRVIAGEWCGTAMDGVSAGTSPPRCPSTPRIGAGLANHTLIDAEPYDMLQRRIDAQETAERNEPQVELVDIRTRPREYPLCQGSCRMTLAA